MQLKRKRDGKEEIFNRFVSLLLCKQQLCNRCAYT